MFHYENVKNPEYFQENRLKAHSDHEYYKNTEVKQMVHEGFVEENEFRHSLNGVWKFAYAKNMECAIRNFEKEDVDCKAWDDIRVPAHIQMEGYDAPQYANVQYPWDGREQIEAGEVSALFNPVASYVKYFNLPEAMKNHKVIISFQGVESGMALWCNGEFVGYSEDTFTPSEFELTPYLKAEENKLAVQVFKWTSSSWCEDQDFFRFSGIFRDVYLYTFPEVHVQDLRVLTLLEDSFKKADLDIEILATNSGKAVFVLKDGGKTIIREEAKLTEKSHHVFTIEEPKLWSAEKPDLYELLIEVYDEQDNLMEVVCQKVGFRRFEMINQMMHLNGKRIVFKGANRHEFSSKTGRVVSYEEMVQDVVTMKRNNINAIRTCHYPDDSRLYKLCDEYGLYLIDETNLESHGSWDPVMAGKGTIDSVVPGDNPKWSEMMLDRVNSIYQRDKNHPAVLIWSCGNESFGGKNIFEMSQLFRKLDPSRLVHYEGVYNDRRYNDTSDIESRMYPSVDEIKEFLQEDRRKPYICCEYTHAMGNSCGAMHKYTDLTDAEPLYQGGFIWDYIDQSIQKKDRYGKNFQAYGGDFDDHPCDYNFSGNGIVYGGERDESPKMQEVKFNYQNISVLVKEQKFTVINKNLFTCTCSYDTYVILEKEGKKIAQVAVETAVEPLGEMTYDLPESIVKRVELGNGEYAITVSFVLKEDTIWAKKGHEIAFGQGVFGTFSGINKTVTPFEVIQGDYNIGVRGENFDVLFSYLNGGLVSYRYAGKEMIKAIPKPNFWRAPVDNDYGNLMPYRYGQWKLASMYLTHKVCNDDAYKTLSKEEKEALNQKSQPRLEIREDCAIITYTYFMPTIPASECELSYTVFGDGTIRTNLSYETVKELGDMPEFGVLFKLDADYDQVEWYGMGPDETYADRDKGAKLGIYKNKVSENMAKYLVPQECGNKTGVRYAKVTDYKGRGMIFGGDQIHFSALPYTPHELENAAHDYELPQVHYTVIRVSKGQMGIAGDDSWGAKTHPEYLLETKGKIEFEFSFKGV